MNLWLVWSDQEPPTITSFILSPRFVEPDLNIMLTRGLANNNIESATDASRPLLLVAKQGLMSVHYHAV